MNELSIRTHDGRTAFEPGERITVVAQWEFDFEPESMEIRVGWTTAGKGTTDKATEKIVPIPGPRHSEAREVVLDLPNAPHSFSGKLISLIWALELVVPPLNPSRLEITIAPDAQEIRLHPPAGDDLLVRK